MCFSKSSPISTPVPKEKLVIPPDRGSDNTQRFQDVKPTYGTATLAEKDKRATVLGQTDQVS